MYHDFFGLREAPFRITPNTDFFFGGGNRGAILDALLYAIGQGEGIVKVTGEVGSGKTMLCRMLQARLPADVLGIYLANPSVSPDEILHAIAHELELPLPAGSGRLEAMQRLNAFLLECHAGQRQVVLFVEESQSMPIATLEEIRLLSNLETDRHKLLQIVLFGQPELDALLRKPEIRQLRERITHSFTLAPLSAADIGLYLNFRLRAAGYKGPDVFGPAVVSRIARASAGLTRRVNLLGDKTLLAAFSENTHAVATRHVRAAIRDSEFAQGDAATGAGRAWPAIAAGLAAMLAITAGAWLLASSREPPALVIGTGADAGTAEPSSSTAPASPAPAPAVSAPPAAAPPIDAPPVAAPPVAAPPVAAAAAPVAEPEAPRQPPTTPAGSLLASRLAATGEWLKSAEPTRVTIQLMGAPSEDQLDRQLRALSRQVTPDLLFVIRTRAGDRPSMTVFYGDFASRAEAVAAMQTLPVALRTFSPHLRTVQGIRTELGAPGS
ncbi:MAG: AAA family ATPase [Burkholderiales bacterium]|nr:AAA family ATPase [Burkholderiales bacterium]